MPLLWSSCRLTAGVLCRARQITVRRRLATLTVSREPLRILYCGSDDFSVAALRKLNHERIEHPDHIESIDVLCKPPQRVGRGLKKVRQVAIKNVAEELGLPLHQISTFTGWQPPSINLIIAVSFGLFVPARVLSTAKYGGLNVHPSSLPDLRGPAPLHHALLHGRTSVGISLQTLSPVAFDHGKVLSQIELPMPNGGCCTFQDLLYFVTPHAADLLLDGLRDRLYVNPVSVTESGQLEKDQSLLHAPKVKPSQAMIDWQRWTAQYLLRAQRALSPLWNRLENLHYCTPDADTMYFTDQNLRIQWYDMKELPQPNLWSSTTNPYQSPKPGRLDILMRTASAGKEAEKVAGVWLDEQKFMAVDHVTVAGRSKRQKAVDEVAALLALHKNS